MKIIYEPITKVLEVDGVEYHNVAFTAYHALLADPNPEYHFKKYILPVYLKEKDRCVMFGGRCE